MPQRGTLLRWLTALTGVVVLGCSGLAITVGRADPAGPALIFYDDFDGPAGARPADHWRYDVGGGGWGNNEMQVYTDHPDNVSLDGAGHLAISARREADGVITSARVTTKGTMEFTTGRVEARIAFPAGTGLHSALWLLGSNIDTVGWPECGEIDVMEALNAVTHAIVDSNAAWLSYESIDVVSRSVHPDTVESFIAAVTALCAGKPSDGIQKSIDRARIHAELSYYAGEREISISGLYIQSRNEIGHFILIVLGSRRACGTLHG